MSKPDDGHGHGHGHGQGILSSSHSLPVHEDEYFIKQPNACVHTHTYNHGHGHGIFQATDSVLRELKQSRTEF